VKKMEVTFMGTGGGRFNLISQLRRTGGFVIRGAGLQMHIDPGPGALAACHVFSIDPKKTSAVVVTHNHIDHLNDAALMLEAMTTFPPKLPSSGRSPNPIIRFHGRKRGALVSASSVLEGDEYGERGISSYFTGKLSRAIVARQGTPVRIGCATLTPTPVHHDDGTGFGFVLGAGGCRIGYTSDTEYFPSLAKHFARCDLLIANSLKCAPDGVGGHLYTAATARLVSECRPGLCAISHFGTSLIKSGPEAEAGKIEKASGVRTIAATDGMRVDARTLKVKKWPQK